jgi:flagellar capping protein FliD
VTSSDGTKVTASLTGSAEAGIYDVKVNQLAAKHKVASDGEDTGLPAKTYTGSFTINGVAISASNHTISDIATLINNANAGVTASAETYTLSGTNYRRLVIESKSTGSAAAVKSTDVSNILRDMGVLNPDLSVKNQLVGALDSKVLVNGVEFVRSSNTATDVIDGLTVNFVAVGTSTLTVTTSGGALRGLGILNAAGSLASELGVAQDAQFSVNGLSVSRSSNTVSDVVEGLTLTLKKAGTSTITVSKDNQKFIDAAKSFVDQYNSTMDFLKTQTAWDTKTKKGGALMGDGTITQIRSELRRAVTSIVPGLPTTLNSPSQVGLTTGKYDSPDRDKLLFDSAKLSEQLDKDPNGVARVFGTLLINAGLATNGGTATASSTAAGSYAAADVINGDTSGARFGSSGGGWQSAAAPSEASPDLLEIAFSGTRTIDQVKVHMLDTTSQKATEHALRNFDVEYWTGSEWKAVAKVKDNTLGVATQEFSPVSASKIRLKITATNGTNNPSKVLEVEAFQKNEGVAARAYAYAWGYTLSGTGLLAEKQKSFDKQAKILSDQITRFGDRLVSKEAALKRQFTALEKTLSKLKNQGSAISSQLAQVSNFRWGRF